MFSFNVIMSSVRGHVPYVRSHGSCDNAKAKHEKEKVDSPVVAIPEPASSDSFQSLESGPLSPSGDRQSGVAATPSLLGEDESPGGPHGDSETSTSSDSDSEHGPWGGFIRFVTKPVRFPGPSKGGSKKASTKKKAKRVRPEISSSLDANLCHLKSSWKNFPLSELQKATNNFSQENLIGQGGYAEVYKGELQDGQFVAIKKLTKGSAEEMTVDYLSELGIIAHVDHPNIAKLIGYGVEGGMHLILQLSPHGSLSSMLYGRKERLSWEIRFKVAIGTAKGLKYLHEGCQRRIIHKDIKASNILLTEDFDAQISDFGLAKWLPDQWTHHIVSQIEGTIGYLPPEFFMHGIVDEKTDVYAYGVLLLELITGRQAIDNSQQSLVMWAKPLIQNNNIKELVDPALGNNYDPEQLNLAVFTASMCINHSAIQRPQMKQALEMLKGDPATLEMMKEQQNLSQPRSYSSLLDELDDGDYNSTEYLNEMSIQMESPLDSSDKDEIDLHEKPTDVETENFRKTQST